MTTYQLTHLRALEAESIHIIREVAAEFERPVLLFSGGKDSIVMLRLAEKAFWPGPLPVPGHARRHRPQLPRGHRVPRPPGRRGRRPPGRRLGPGRHRHGPGHRGDRAPGQPQPAPDRDAARRHRGARLRRRLRRRPARRGEGPGQGAGVLVPRRVRPVGPQEPAARAVEPLQRPAPQGRAHPGVPDLATGPSSTSGSTSRTSRSSSRRSTSPTSARCSSGTACCWRSASSSPCRTHEEVADHPVRYRTVGDASCTGAVESSAATIEDVIAEVAATRITERGATRADDRISEAAMEDRKREGYF